MLRARNCGTGNVAKLRPIVVCKACTLVRGAISVELFILRGGAGRMGLYWRDEEVLVYVEIHKKLPLTWP